MRALIVLAVALLTSTSYAQDLKLKSIPPGESQIVVLRVGEKAPFDGQLYSNDTALRWANWLNQCELHYKVGISTEQAIRKIESEGCQSKIKIYQDAYDRTVTNYDQKLKKAELGTQPWYDSFWFGATVGTVGALVLFSASVYAASQLD